MALLDPDAINESMARTLGKYRESATFLYDLQDKPTDVNSVYQIKANATAYINTLDKALTPGTRKRMAEYVDMYSSALQEALKDGSLPKGISAVDLNEMMLDNVDKMVYQETETRKRQLGDHGIRHVTGNIENSFKMLDEIEGTTGYDKLFAAQVMVDHDMGYTAGVVQKSFEATKYHELFSEKYARSQDEQYRKVFGDRTNEMYNALATHADFDLDWQGQPVLSSIRTADNLALFARDKLPALFMDVPGATTALYKLQLAKSVGQDKEMLPRIKQELSSLVDNTNLDDRIKAELHSAVEEIVPATSKFTLGMLAGEIDGFAFDGNRMEVDLVSKPEREVLNGLFDLGNRQFDKFLGGYNSEGSAGDNGVDLLEKDTGDRVLNIRYRDESATVANSELVELHEVSVRPIINKLRGAIGDDASTELKDSVWNSIEKPLGVRLGGGELEDFRKRFYDGTLGEFPLSAKEKAYLEAEYRAKHLPGKHDQKSHGHGHSRSTLPDYMPTKYSLLAEARMRSGKGRFGAFYPGERASHFELLGHSKESVEDMDRLLDNYSYGDPEQRNIEAQIIGHIVAGDDVGQAIKDQINLEDRLLKVWIEGNDARLVDERKSFEGDWAWYFPRQGGLNVGDAWYGADYGRTEGEAKAAAWDATKNFYESWNSEIYRKGTTKQPGDYIESWSEDPHGAAMAGPGSNIGWDVSMRMDELYSNGYHVLGGYAKLMGAPGEAELTLIRFPEDTKLKHLPGMHSQPSHTPRIYLGGTPVTPNYFADGGSHLLNTLSQDMRRTVMDALIAYKITEEELQDLNGFTDKPAPGYSLSNLNYFEDPDDPDRQVLGVYDPDTRMVHIAPMMANRSDGGKVVLHELGHHVVEVNPNYRAKRAAAMFVISQLRHRRVGPVNAIDYGLREYSFTNENEFLADTFKVYKAGNEVQKRNLDDIYNDVLGFTEGMEGVLKHLAGKHDQKSHGRGNMGIGTLKNSYDELVPSLVGGREELAYMIAPDSKNIADVHDFNGKKYINHYRLVSDYPELFGDDPIQAGWIRVRDVGLYVSFETSTIDAIALRRLQQLVDGGLIKLHGKLFDWSSKTSGTITGNSEDFMMAKSAEQLRKSNQFKSLLHADEIISVHKGNVIQFIVRPTTISEAQASETPWYYTNVYATEPLVKLAMMLKHLPGRHNQKTHAPHIKRIGGIEMAPADIPDMEQNRIDAVKRIQEWRASGRSDADIARDGYKWRFWAHRDSISNRHIAWEWAMWEQIQGVAEKQGYKYKKVLTAKDVFDDPDMDPENLAYAYDKRVRDKWARVDHYADEYGTNWRNDVSSRDSMDEWLNTEDGKAHSDYSIKQLWYNARKVGTDYVPGGKGYGASRHFDKYRPFAGLEELANAKNFEEAKNATVELYRGVEREEYATEDRRVPFISYTTSPEIAKLFAEGYAHSYNKPGQGMVVKRRIKAKDMLAFINNDGELEVLVKPPKANVKEKELDVELRLNDTLDVALKHLANNSSLPTSRKYK